LINVIKIHSEIFSSNVYLITSSDSDDCWLIDSGAFMPVVSILKLGARLKAIFLTHYHYDHIYFLNKWIELFPNVMVFGSKITQLGVASAKRNLSYYHENPLELDICNFQTLSDCVKVPLFEKYSMLAKETEGHCEGSLTYLLEDYIFTGDSLIPNIPIVTKLKSGNKVKAKQSIYKIKNFISPSSIICPGHLDMTHANEVDWNFYLNG
jgi:hydroxyacylglutathione hydrolase